MNIVNNIPKKNASFVYNDTNKYQAVRNECSSYRQTGSKIEAFFAAFRKKTESNGANTLAECVAHSEAYNKASYC